MSGITRVLIFSDRGRRIVFGWTIAFFIFPWQLSGEEPTSRDENAVFDSDYAASLLEALLLNNRSIDRYDVLFTREVLSVDPAGAVSEFKTKYRICRDRYKRTWLATCALQSDTWKGDTEPVSSKRVIGLLVTSDGHAYVRDLNGIREVPETDVERMPALTECPSFLTLGLEAFPDTHTVDSSADGYWNRVFQGRIGLSSDPGIDGQVIVRLTVPNKDSDPVDYKWIFDAATMLPRVREAAVVLRRSGKRLVKERDNLQWTEISGVNVPLSIHRSTLRTSVAADGSRVSFEITDDTEFEWNQVGSELNDTLFTLAHFRSINPGEFLQISKVAK
jgi:hypothetical protein